MATKRTFSVVFSGIILHIPTRIKSLSYLMHVCGEQQESFSSFPQNHRFMKETKNTSDMILRFLACAMCESLRRCHGSE